MKRQIAAYLMLSVALAATVFCYTLQQGMAGSHIVGASPARRYFALGIATNEGVTYTVSGKLVGQLAQRLPNSFALAGAALDPFVSLALPNGSKRVDVATELVSAHYFQAVDLRHVLGRVISPAEVNAHEPVMVINRRCADALFGSARAAINRALVLHMASGATGLTVHVIGVVTHGFAGVYAQDESYHKQLAWMPFPLPYFLPPLLSVPANLPQAEIRHNLDLAWHGVPETVRGKGSHGLVFTQPFSFRPRAVATAVRQFKLYLSLAAATLLLTVVNLGAVNFLEVLRRRDVHAIERTLGATRAWQMRRVLYRALLGALVTLVVSGTLLGAALVFTRRAISAQPWSAHSQWRRVWQVLHWPHLLIPTLLLILVVLLIEVLVHGVSLARERQASGAARVSSPRGERQVGALILALEFTLAVFLAVLALWGVQYAWRMAHENLGMLQGQRLTVLRTNLAHLSGQSLSNAFGHSVSNAVLGADLQRAIAGIAPHAELGFGPVIGFPYRHGAGNFRTQGMGKLEAGQAGVVTQGFTASSGWLPVGGVQLLAGRNFSHNDPDPHAILIDAQVARTLFGSVPAAVGRSVEWHRMGENAHLLVRGVIRPLCLHGPGRAPVASYIAPMQGGGKAFGFVHGGNILIRPAIPVARYLALKAAVRLVFAKDASFLEVSGVQSSTQLLSRLDRPQRVLATVFGAMAGFGLLIALSGLAMFLRLFLTMRKRVDAIRQALGASPRRLYTGVVGGTVILGVAGALLALLFTPWLAQQFALLSGAQVAPYGAATWIALAVLLLAVFLVAHFPARKAARAEPAQSLHEL